MSFPPNAFERLRESTLFTSRWLPLTHSVFVIATLLLAAPDRISGRRRVV